MLWHQTYNHDIAIELHIEDEKLVYNGKDFFFSDIKERAEFRPFSRWMFYAQKAIEVYVTGRFGEEYPTVVPSDPPVEVFSLTHVSKGTPKDIPLPFIYGHFLVSVIIYPETTGFKSALVLVTKPTNTSVPFNVTTTDDNGTVIGYEPDRVFDGNMPKNQFLPKCSLTQTKNVDKYSLEFTYRTVSNTASNASFVATVKTDKGYISHQKLSVVDGTANLVFIPLGLTEGEVAKVQVGIGKFTEVASVEIPC